MDIDKICRCCLALSGPLLSIYDGGSAGSGCVADMLRDIAKLRPQQNDNMPEKVCLSCISEINRCYVFKIKCENSNKTLRQLLPDAVKEIFDATPKVVRSDAGMQTDEKVTNSAQIQTLPPEMPAMVHRDMQTDPDVYAGFDNKTTEILETSGGEPFIGEQIDKIETKRKQSIDNSLPTTTKRNQTWKKMRFDEIPQQSCEEEGQNTYIVVEAVNIESNSSDEQELIIQHISDSHQDTKSDHTPSHLEYYDSIEEDDTDNIVRNSSNLQESDYTCDVANESFNEKDSDNDSSTPQQQNILPNQQISSNAEAEENKTNAPPKRTQGQRREQYKCYFCIMTFVSLKVLRRHLSKRHGIADTDVIVDEFPLEIEKNEESYSQDSIKEQVELTEDNVPNPRLLPRERVSNKTDKQLHTKFKYFCEYCEAGFAQRKTLAYHMKQKICMTNNFKCNICERIFISEENLETHKNTHNNQYTCLECDKECGTIEELSDHMIEEHNRNARNQCHICKKVFTMRASLMDHLRIHSGEKPFLCTVCGKGFCQNSNLRQHLMRHTNEKNFKCDNCPKAYVTKAELFSHKRTHTGDHPFKCDICSATFTSSSSLLKHKRKHTGERPYVCEYCPMRFAALNVLKNHQRTHTGEKPYKCSFCDKCFTQKGDCLLHQRTHELGEVICFCGSKFSKISNLRQHLKNKHPNMTDEKRKELDESLSRRKSNQDDTEIQITLTEEDDDACDNDEYVTIHDVDDDGIEDDNTIISQSQVDEVSEDIMADM